jgi:large subunit ribosomal protein L4
MKATIYTNKGEKSGEIDLPEEIFGLRYNSDLVHQVVTSIRANARTGTAHAKDRSEVAGGGKKPWKQKGTGRARHGSTRSPIWRKGGVTHGPRNDKNYSQKINRKMGAAALFSALSQKLRDGELVFIDSLSLGAPKTKDAKSILSGISNIKGCEKLANRRNNAAVIASPSVSDAVTKSFRNIGSVVAISLQNMSVEDVLTKKFVIIESPKEAIEFLSSKLK